MTRAMQRRMAGLVAVAVAGTSLWWVSRSDLEDAIVYYLTPTELIGSAHAHTSKPTGLTRRRASSRGHVPTSHHAMPS